MLTTSQPPTQQVLNGSDRTMLTYTRVARENHWGSFGHVLQIELEGRADVARVRELIARMGRVHPVLTSRLVEQSAGPAWAFRPDAVCPLEVIPIAEPCDENRQEFIGRLLRTTVDFAQQDPVSFHLLQLANGRDVLVVHYDHVISGAMAFGLIIDELHRLDEVGVDSPVPWQNDPVPIPPPRTTLRDRWRIFQSVWRNFRKYGGASTVRLTSPQNDRRCLPGTDWGVARTFCRKLSIKETAAWRSMWSRALGLPSASISLFASVLRTAWKHRAPDCGKRQRSLITVLGLDLRPRRSKGPIFENSLSVLPMIVGPEDLENRAGLTTLLVRQLREQIKLGVDRLGAELMANYREHWPVRRGLRQQILHRRMFWYGYLNELTKVDSLCGLRVRDITVHIEPWPIHGVSILGYEYRGQMCFSVASLPGAITDDRVQRFIDDTLHDLLPVTAAAL